VKTLTLGLVLMACVSLSAEKVSQDPRELGTVILGEMAIKDKKVIIRVASGGCTDKAAIKANVQQEKGLTERTPHYRVTFERVRVDDCKALLMDGILLEYDISSDLRISGPYTLSVANGVSPR
jgi:hypothetical protein